MEGLFFGKGPLKSCFVCWDRLASILNQIVSRQFYYRETFDSCGLQKFKLFLIFFHVLAMIDCRVTFSIFTTFFLILFPLRLEKFLKVFFGIVNFLKRGGDDLLLSFESCSNLTLLASSNLFLCNICPEEYFAPVVAFPESLLSKPLSDNDFSL